MTQGGEEWMQEVILRKSGLPTGLHRTHWQPIPADLQLFRGVVATTLLVTSTTLAPVVISGLPHSSVEAPLGDVTLNTTIPILAGTATMKITGFPSAASKIHPERSEGSVDSLIH